ncbi:MAG: hypothetical protein JOZ83_11940 [Silvibacterium sp.]|nr:hypothetical protein [Silvibacterium sp.]
MDSSKSPVDDPDPHRKVESATAIFGTVPAEPAAPEDDVLKSLLADQSRAAAPAETPWTPVNAPTPPEPPSPASSSGGFTDVFQALQNPAKPDPGDLVPGSTPNRPTDLSSVFTQVVVEKTSFSPPPSSPRKAGEFTQLLQTLRASEPKPETQAGPPLPLASPAAAPGAFTQLFSPVTGQAAFVEAEPTATVPMYSPPVPVSKEPAKPDSSGPAGPQQNAQGDFTRMFQSLTSAGESVPSSSPVPPSTPQPSSEPGTFTQMFAAKPLESTPAEDPLRSLRPEPPSPLSSSTFSFQSPAARPPEPAPLAQGGFTQLFQALTKEETPAKSPEPSMPPPPPLPATSGPGVGGFTQLLQTLSADPAARPAAQPVPMPPTPSIPAPAPFSPAPPISGAPGEFTRVISGSQLRDLQNQQKEPGPPVLLPQQPLAARPAPPAPIQFPSAPQFPASPQIPQMQTPQMPAAHAPSSAPLAGMPQYQPSAFPFPPAPPASAPPPPAPSKLQQYLPLILVLNIFVLLVIIVILIFVLRHH